MAFFFGTYNEMIDDDEEHRLGGSDDEGSRVRGNANVMASHRIDPIQFKTKDKVRENTWKDLQIMQNEMDNDPGKMAKEEDGMPIPIMVPIPEYKFILDERILIEIVQQDYSTLSGIDVVGIPATSTLFPTLKGPRDLYAKAGRLKINSELKEKLKAKNQPYELTECERIQPHDLTKVGIKELLFITCPTELFKNNDFYRRKQNQIDKINKLRMDIQNNTQEKLQKEEWLKGAETEFNNPQEQNAKEKNMTMEQYKKMIEDDIIDLKETIYSLGKTIRDDTTKLNAEEPNLKGIEDKWKTKMKWFFQSFYWSTLDKFKDTQYDSLAIPPLALDMEIEPFTDQEIAYLQLITMSFYLAHKVRPDHPMCHVKVVCQTDGEYLAWRKAYDRYVLEGVMTFGQ